MLINDRERLNVLMRAQDEIQSRSGASVSDDFYQNKLATVSRSFQDQLDEFEDFEGSVHVPAC
jgi:hypothetical protein